MGVERKVVWKLFLAHEVEEEQAWLESMAGRGWHLRRSQLVRFVFERGEPRACRFRLDFQPRGVDLEEYLGLFRDAGWQLVTFGMGWFYFRADRPDVPEVFTDPESRHRMARRQMAILILALAVQLPALWNLGRMLRLDGWGPLIPLLMLHVGFICLLGWCLLRLMRGFRDR